MLLQRHARRAAKSDAFLHDARSALAARDKLRFLLDYGVLAPGGHPWRIAMGGEAVELYLGHHCGRVSHDPEHRETIIGCGIGLAQLRLALRQLGCIDSTIILPDESQPDLLARVYIDAVEETDPATYMLYQALSGPPSGAGRPLDGALLSELAGQASFERATLSYESPDALPSSRPGPMERAPDECNAPRLESVVQRLAWMGQNVTGGVPFMNVVGGVIGTQADGVADWLAAGQALARVALRARVEGLVADVQGTRRGARALNGAFAQVALRIGAPAL